MGSGKENSMGEERPYTPWQQAQNSRWIEYSLVMPAYKSWSSWLWCLVSHSWPHDLFTNTLFKLRHRWTFTFSFPNEEFSLLLSLFCLVMASNSYQPILLTASTGPRLHKEPIRTEKGCPHMQHWKTLWWARMLSHTQQSGRKQASREEQRNCLDRGCNRSQLQRWTGTPSG